MSLLFSFTMVNFFSSTLLAVLVVVVDARCKNIPGSSGWPSTSAWSSFNKTLGGALIQTTTANLPAAPCHPQLPTYNNATCAAIQKEWYTWAFHEANPVSNGINNWNNDSCLPSAAYPCTTAGYPSYVVNASTVPQVQAAVNFARQNNIRLNIKVRSGGSRSIVGCQSSKRDP